MPGLDGSRARARHHDQGAGRARALDVPGRGLRAQPDRHARARRLRASCLPLAGGLRGSDPRRRCGAGASRRRRSRTRTWRSSNDLEIVPVLNKIDLPAADPDEVARPGRRLPRGRRRGRAAHLRQDREWAWGRCSTRSCERVPPPAGDPSAPARALVFDSVYDQYRGVDRVRARRRRGDRGRRQDHKTAKTPRACNSRRSGS